MKAWEQPEVNNTDKAPTYGIAISELKAEATDPARARFQDAEGSACDDCRVEVMRALRKGQAAIFNLTRDIRGEERIVERAFGVSPSALAEAITLVGETLNLQSA